ncbi:MAG: hypothetical protein ABSF38_21810 [Verrucomicrobiota bacterium]|jgi:hypothetical protein
MKNQLSRFCGASRLGVGAAFLALCAFTSVSRGQALVDNLVGSGAPGTALADVEGLKNGLGASYSQGFETGSSSVNLDTLTLDLGLLDNSGTYSTETMSVYLYNAYQTGGDAGQETGAAIATLATGITDTKIYGSTYEGLSTGNNASYIYQYSVSLASTPSLSSDTVYAIEVDFSSGNHQDIGWAETDTLASGEVGGVETDPYGMMEINGPNYSGGGTGVPDGVSTALLLGGVLTAIGLAKRKMS